MFSLKKSRDWLSDKNFLVGLLLCRTTMGFLSAIKYWAYQKFCNLCFKLKKHSSIESYSSEFKSRGHFSYQSPRTELTANIVNKRLMDLSEKKSVWDKNGTYLGDIKSDFPELLRLFEEELMHVFEEALGSHVKAFYWKLYKSINSKEISGSQLWHSDGGPGSCLNVLFYVTQTSKKNGAMEIIDWEESKKLILNFRIASRTYKSNISKAEIRDKRNKFYDGEIKAKNLKLEQPIGKPGIVFGFSNNCLHKGGYPAKGEHRIALMLHVYPAVKKRYELSDFNLNKSAPYPSNPMFNLTKSAS